MKKLIRDAPELAITRLFVRLVRLLHGGTQQALARDSRVAASTIAAAERGLYAITPRTAAKLAAAAGIEGPDLEFLIFALREMVARRSGAALDHPLPAGLVRRGGPWEETAAGLARAFELLLARPRTLGSEQVAGTAGAGGEDAATLWQRLSSYPFPQQRALVLGGERFRTLDLAIFLCNESLAAAAESAQLAVDLAELALLIARLTPAEPPRRTAVQAWAHAHLGNALRVRGDHAAAEQAFETARELWVAAGETCASLFDEARLFGLEASLRRDQRRFDEAMVLLDEALAKDSVALTPHLLINKARLLSDMGNIEAALESLERAEPVIAGVDQPRLLFTARFNRADHLSLLERHEEAARWLLEARRLAMADASVGALDRLRLDWVGGRVAAGTDWVAEGIAALERVRRELTARGMAYDAALAALELAALYLADGGTERVKALVREMLPAFQSREIHREALAALRLFHRAAEQEQATSALAREVAHFLHRARHNPELQLTRTPATGL
jgi:tetratricopeptide (TPR) repeat protein